MQDPEEQSEENFDQFQVLTQKLLKVPKKEVDALREKQAEAARERKTETKT